MSPGLEASLEDHEVTSSAFLKSSSVAASFSKIFAKLSEAAFMSAYCCNLSLLAEQTVAACSMICLAGCLKYNRTERRVCLTSSAGSVTLPIRDSKASTSLRSRQGLCASNILKGLAR